VLGSSGCRALKMPTSAERSQPEKASLESCCSASSAHGTARTDEQRLGLLACLVLSIFKRSLGGPCPCASGSPALKMLTSADSSQAERASLESCCSASSAHGNDRTEAQRLGLLSSLATSKFKRRFGRPCRGTPAAVL